MSKVRLVNKLTQALPVLLKDPKDPKRLRQHSIRRKGAKLIPEELLSPHCQSLYKRGFMDIVRLESVKTPTGPAEKMSSPSPPKKTVKPKTKPGRKVTRRKKK